MKDATPPPQHSMCHSVLLLIGTQSGRETHLTPKATDGHARPERGQGKEGRKEGRVCVMLGEPRSRSPGSEGRGGS